MKPIKGISVYLMVSTQTDTDPFGAPIITEQPVEVENVLVGEPASDDIVNDLNLYGKRLAYTLAIPKGDTHHWEDAQVSFFGETFKAYGPVTQGIEDLIPLSWNKKVHVEKIS